LATKRFLSKKNAFVKELGNDKLISHNEKYKPIPLELDDSIFCCGRVLDVVESKTHRKIRICRDD